MAVEHVQNVMMSDCVRYGTQLDLEPTQSRCNESGEPVKRAMWTQRVQVSAVSKTCLSRIDCGVRPASFALKAVLQQTALLD